MVKLTIVLFIVSVVGVGNVQCQGLPSTPGNPIRPSTVATNGGITPTNNPLPLENLKPLFERLLFLLKLRPTAQTPTMLPPTGIPKTVESFRAKRQGGFPSVTLPSSINLPTDLTRPPSDLEKLFLTKMMNLKQQPTGLPPTGHPPVQSPTTVDSFRAKRQAFYTGPTKLPSRPPLAATSQLPSNNQKSIVENLMEILGVNLQPTGQPPKRLPTGRPPVQLPTTVDAFRAKRQAFSTGQTTLPPRPPPAATSQLPTNNQKSIVENLMEILGVNLQPIGQPPKRLPTGLPPTSRPRA
uniref:Uncharacterized protein n=1 Tax=Panagrolaimus davidi TaxID=227884 RepID=A0A914QNR2_9BILA